MRLFSNPESVDKGEISALAITETVLAMAIAVGIGILRDYWNHILVAVSVAPFLLLRTDAATARSVRWLDWAHGEIFVWTAEQLYEKSWLLAPIASAIYMFALFLLPFPLRVASVLLGVITNPGASVKAIPSNWKRFALALDFAHPPEVMPGYLKYGEPGTPYTISFYRRYWWDRIRSARGLRGFLMAIVYSMAAIEFAAGVYVPAFLYRMSLKSTSLIYLPFLWIISSAFPKSVNAEQMLQLIKENEVERLRRTYSLAALVVLYIAPILLLSHFSQEISLLQSHFGKSADLISIYTFVFTLKPWHIVRLLNIILTFYLFFYADSKLRQVRYGRPLSDGGLNHLVPWILLVRGLGAMYTLFCGLYILYTTVDFRIVFDWRFLPF